MKDKILLIDGHSILNRAFYALPVLTNSEGTYTNAVLGFLNIILKIMEDEKPTYLTVAFDVNKKTFRHEMFEEYKGTRKSMPEELRPQVLLMKEVLKAMGVTIIEKEGYEADDILGTIAKSSEKIGLDVTVLSGDRDLLQLATESIKIKIPKTKKGGTEVENYNAYDVVEKYGVTPLQFIDLKALMGDASDNIPGVPGIGEKTASKIITAFDSIENAYAHVDEVTPNKARESLRDNYDLAVLSKTLATIKTDCEVEYSVEDAKLGNLYNEEAYELFKKLELKSLLSKFQLDVASNSEKEETFQVITDITVADKLFDKIKKTKKSNVGFKLIIESNEVLGLSITYNEAESYFIKVENFITENYFGDKLLELQKAGIVLSTFFLKEQLPFLQFVSPKNLFDLSIAAYLINPLKDSYEYDNVAREYLSLSVPSKSDYLGKSKLKDGIENEGKEAMLYVTYEGHCAYVTYTKVADLIKQYNMMELFYDIEMPLIFTLFHMESMGIGVDKDGLKAYGDRLAITIERLEKDIYGLVGEEFNINSPKQLGVILFEKLQLPFGKKTKTGYSTSADILERLKLEHPVVDMVLEYRQVTKLKSTYADGLANFISDDNRIHGKFHQTIAATGRLSSTEPNLQNIPIRMALGREIRKVFIPREGYVFVDADYSQIELRVLAHMANDEKLLAAYKSEQDIHRITASEVFHTPIDEVTSLQRSNAKAVNFGIVYGISSFGLGQDLNITRKEAEGYINKYFETYPGVKNFLEQLVVDGKENGVVTTIFGRRRPIPELASSNFMQRSFGERIAMNSPIQGTAADIIKIAMNKVHNRLEQEGLKSRLILQVHDELLIEAAEDEVEKVKTILKEEMQSSANLDVQLLVDVNVGNTWYDAK